MRHKNVDFELQGKVSKYLEYMMHKESNNGNFKQIDSYIEERTDFKS